jgi:hypothetical protein
MGLAIFKKDSGKMIFWSEAWKPEILYDADDEESGTLPEGKSIGDVKTKITRPIADDEVSENFDESPEFDFDTHFFNSDTMEIEERTATDTISRTYKRNRSVAYPAIGDQLDAMWKFLSTLDLDDDTQAMLDAINAIKSDFPKK